MNEEGIENSIFDLKKKKLECCTSRSLYLTVPYKLKLFKI